MNWRDYKANKAALDRAALIAKHRARVDAFQTSPINIRVDGTADLDEDLRSIVVADPAFARELRAEMRKAEGRMVSRYLKRARDLESKQRKGKR